MTIGHSGPKKWTTYMKMKHLCMFQWDCCTKGLYVHTCILPNKALKDLLEIHETLCVIYISLWPFLIERGHKGHQAFTTFSKPALRHGPGHIPLKHWHLVVLVGLVISGYVHNQISWICWWYSDSISTEIKTWASAAIFVTWSGTWGQDNRFFGIGILGHILGHGLWVSLKSGYCISWTIHSLGKLGNDMSVVLSTCS